MRKNKQQFPSEKETLQEMMGLLFGSNKEEVSENISKTRVSIFKYGILLSAGVTVLAFLILNN